MGAFDDPSSLTVNQIRFTVAETEAEGLSFRATSPVGGEELGHEPQQRYLEEHTMSCAGLPVAEGLLLVPISQLSRWRL